MRNLKEHAILLLLVVTALFGFMAFFFIGRAFCVPDSVIGSICSAAAVFAGALVAYRAFVFNRRMVQEPWSVIFRELHKEFWSDRELAKARLWICCDQAYADELLPVLRLPRAQIDADAYKKLETLDNYCALMLRVTYLPTANMTEEQSLAFRSLGYDWWLYKTTLRTEIDDYIARYWQNLHARLPKSPPVPIEQDSA